MLFFSLSFFFPLSFFPKLAPCSAIAQWMKDCVPLPCLAITMTPRLNHVKSSDILAVVEMPTTLSLKRIATMSVEMVRVFWFWVFWFLYFVSHKHLKIFI